MENKMFCFQCEQTMNCSGCTSHGVCGKSPEVAGLQDLLLYGLKGLAMYVHRLRTLGVVDRDINIFTLEALFSTVTNVNFDAERLQNLLQKLVLLREKAKQKYEEKTGASAEKLPEMATWIPAQDISGLLKQRSLIGVDARRQKYGSDLVGLQELLTYGLKGVAAYADHAQILGKEDDSVYAFFHEALNFLAESNHSEDELVSMIFKCGETNLKVMGLLDAANTGVYGHPEPTKVRVTPVKGKCILVSGHDLRDLEDLLKQTEGKNINVYTHGEMLPCLAYPGLKKYKHLVGNYGSAWQNQQKEFSEFPGAILMTTNCIQRPQNIYKDRIFTSGLVAWPGTIHISDRNFKPVVEAALAAEGFEKDGEDKYITVGFGRNAVMGVAGKVIDLVKAGKIKHFFLVGGCDGAKPGRNYYTEFAEKVPKDCVILTLACGKYRFNKLDFGEIDGIPRLLDIGQCNDAYSAIQIALALAKAFNCGVNELPLSLVLSWYEQKAVCILLTLLSLGLKNIRLGPSLPAFVTPKLLSILQEKFNIMPISTPEKDLGEILGR